MPRDMAIPLAIGIPLMIVAIVLHSALGWSDGALGWIFTALIGGMAALGAMMYPREGRRR